MLIKLEKDAQVLGKIAQRHCNRIQNLDFRAVAIHRRGNTIIPKGDDVFQENDLAYVVTKPDGIDQLLNLGARNVSR
jgi:trk system potassium uptake protein